MTEDGNTMIGKNKLLFPPSYPKVAGLLFRGYRGELDFPNMLEIITAAKKVDGLQRADTLENITNNYSNLVRCDPKKDLIFAEVDGKAVGYGRCWWSQDANTKEYRYTHFVFLKPEWRESGIGEAMSQYLQQRGRETASQHPDDGVKWLEGFSEEKQNWWTGVLENEGYQAYRYGFDMIRDLNDPIPDLACPAGFEIRPYQPEHLHAIWLADTEAFRDHHGFTEPEESEVDFADYQKSPTFNPNLWKVAWFNDEVAGAVLNFVDEAYNKEYNKKRGYTESISTRRPYRKQGLASYIITESMKMFKAMGMDHVALGVDALNPTGALKLYESLGYTVEERSDAFRKPINQ